MSAELIQPPHSIQAENAVLSSILAGSKFHYQSLQPEDFFRHTNRLVFEAILDLSRKREPVDVITVSEHMEAKGTLEEAGGMTLFGDLAIPGGNVNAYAEIVKDNARARALMALGMKLVGADRENWQTLSDEAVSELLESAHTTKRWDCDLATALRDGVDAVDRAFNADGMVGLDTGFSRLNSIFGGWHDSDLIVIGARPAMGKTALLLNTALAPKAPVAIISAEMPRDQLSLRLIASEGKVDATKLRNADLEDSDWAKVTAAVSRLNSKQVAIMDKPAPTLAEVANFARRAKRDSDISALYLDYIQRIKPRDRSIPKHEQVGEAVMGLKELARELKIPVVALAQVNRDVEKRTNKRPQMGDLKDSGSIEQEADAVMLLYRDEVYNVDTTQRGIAELIIDKNRHGQIGTVKLSWDGPHMRFGDLSPNHYRESE